jgi:hypothetical protein
MSNKRVAIIGPVNQQLVDALNKQLRESSTTGSAEPKQGEERLPCPLCNEKSFRVREIYGERLKCRHCGKWSEAYMWKQLPGAPTPPASQPTVTLEKQLEKQVGFRIDERGIRHYRLTGDPYEAEATASEIKLWNVALALLRAAETRE